MFGFRSHPPGWNIVLVTQCQTHIGDSSWAWFWSVPFFLWFLPHTHAEAVASLPQTMSSCLPWQGTSKAPLKHMGAMRKPPEAASQPNTRMWNVLSLSWTFTLTRASQVNSRTWISWRHHVWSKTEISDCIISLRRKSSRTCWRAWASAETIPSLRSWSEMELLGEHSLVTPSHEDSPPLRWQWE